MTRLIALWVYSIALALPTVRAEPPSGDAGDEPFIASVVQQTNHGLTLVSRALKAPMPACEDDSGLMYDDNHLKSVVAKTREARLRTEITEAEAQEIFKELRANPDLPFRYPEDGCFARAHRMAQLLELKGIESRKIFLVGDLRAKSSCAEADPRKKTSAGEVRFGFHVAPTVMVVKPDGSKVKMVLDPSMGLAPEPFETWKSKLTLQPPQNCVQATPATLRLHDQNNPSPRFCQYYEVPRFQYFPFMKNEIGAKASALPQMTRWSMSDTSDAADTLYGQAKIAVRRQTQNPGCIPGQ